MKHGMMFEDKHSYNDFKLIPTSRPVFSPPEANLVKVEVPGRNGSLDMSEALTGGITYKNRTGEFEFYVEDKSNWAKTYSDIMNYLHGKHMQVVLDDDPDFYYDCTIAVNEWKSEEMNSLITIEAEAYPFKKKRQETVVQMMVTGHNSCILKNLREPVALEVSTTSEMRIAYSGKETTLQQGDHVMNIPLKQGDTIVNVYGTGTIIFKYREGSL